MATPDSQQAIQTILATRNTPTAIDYTPIERGAAVKRESAGKQMEKMNTLIALTAQELPAQMQGDLTSGVNTLLKDVKDGKLKPDDIDFTTRMYQLSAKAGTYKTNWERMKGSLAVDPTTGRKKSLITFDERGNPVDKIGDLEAGLLTLNKYDPNINTQDFVAELDGLAAKALYPIPFSTEEVLKDGKSYFDLNADKTARTARLGIGKDVETTVSTLTPGEYTTFVGTVIDSKRASLANMYAQDRANGKVDPEKTSFDDYAYMTISSILPQRKSEQKITSTQYSPFEQSMQATLGAGMGQRQLEGGFIADETPVGNIPYVAPKTTGGSPTSPSPKETRDFLRSAGVNVSESTALKVWRGTVQGQDLDTDKKTTSEGFRNITISAPPGVKEKTIKVTNVDGEVVDVSPKNIVVDKNGRGVLVGVSQVKETETEGVGDVRETKVEKTALKEQVIKMTPSLIKRINSTYGTDILQGAQAPASTSQSDPMGIL
jgi:hypothetical protein